MSDEVKSTGAPTVTATDRALVNCIMFGGTPNDYDRVAAMIAAYREEKIHLALEAERMRDNRVYRAIKELLHASTPADRGNLAAGLLVAMDRLAEKASVSEQAPDHVADAGKMAEKTEAKP